MKYLIALILIALSVIGCGTSTETNRFVVIRHTSLITTIYDTKTGACFLESYSRGLAEAPKEVCELSGMEAK